MSLQDIFKKASIASISRAGDIRGQIFDTGKGSGTTNKTALVNNLKNASSAAAYNIAQRDSTNSGKSVGSSAGSGARTLQNNLYDNNSGYKVDTLSNTDGLSTVDDLAGKNLSGSLYEEIANKNNQINIQMNRENNEFNAQEALKQRRFEELMANTAHQREVQDLQAAGLNPILSAGGTGAVTPNGASAGASNFNGTDNSIVSTLAGLAATSISAQATTSAAAMQAAATTAAASTNAAAMMAAANTSAEAQKYAADTNYATQKYQSDKAQQNSVIAQAGNIITSIIGAYGLGKAAGIRNLK